ncbi:hypothetical protein ERO13_D07G008366v2 [Gossypium hirsutum]|nr:hypothetical protein ERO13_D07G008366v2 [Gossypium hirsutum]
MSVYLLFVSPTLYIYLMVQNMEPRCSIPLPQAGFIKDIVWRRAAKYNFLVLTKDGKLFHGKFPDPSLTELWMALTQITVFSSDLNENIRVVAWGSSGPLIIIGIAR